MKHDFMSHDLHPVSYTHLDVYKRQMITGGYEGNLKAAILAGIVLHIVLYMLSRKQVNLLIQAFKQNGFKEINNLFNMTYVFLIVFFMILIAIKVMRY